MGHSIDTIRNDPRDAFFRSRNLAVNWREAGVWMN